MRINIKNFAQAASKAAEDAAAAFGAAKEAEDTATAALAAERSLEQRIMSGDSVAPAELDKATTSTRFAKLKAIAARNSAEKAAQEAAEAERARERAEAKVTLDRLLAGDAMDSVRTAYAGVVDSIQALIAAVDARCGEESEIVGANRIEPDARVNDTARWKISSVYFQDQGIGWVRAAIEEALGYRPRPAVMGGETPDARTAPTREWPVNAGHRLPEAF